MKAIPDDSVNLILCDLPYGTTQNSWDSVIPLAALWEQYQLFWLRRVRSETFNRRLRVGRVDLDPNARPTQFLRGHQR